MLRMLKAALAFLLAAFPAFAAGIDDGLYAPPPPPEAAFVRYLGDETVELGGVRLEGHRYALIKQGEYTLNRHSLQIEAGKRYSLSASSALLSDPQLENRSRSLLVLYNFTDKPALDLVTADGKLTILSAVARNSNASRVVQPLQVELAVAVDGMQLGKLAPVALERGGSYSVIASGSGEALRLQLVAAEQDGN